ncbi:hypothetical protein A6E03_06785 [Aliivibrio sp. 1S128]|nr:hypothetical protein A6E03_06785 [Aliivibrio sp. 1S128]
MALIVWYNLNICIDTCCDYLYETNNRLQGNCDLRRIESFFIFITCCFNLKRCFLMIFDLFNLILITNAKEVCARSYFFYRKLSFCFMFFLNGLVFISWMHSVYAGKI